MLIQSGPAEEPVHHLVTLKSCFPTECQHLAKVDTCVSPEEELHRGGFLCATSHAPSWCCGMLKSLSGICLPGWKFPFLDGKGQQRNRDTSWTFWSSSFIGWKRAGMFILILENFKKLFLMLTLSDNLALTDPIRDRLTSM